MADPAVAALIAAGPTAADLADIQGLVYGAYSDHGWVGYVLARLDGGVARSRAWLRTIAGDVTSAVKQQRPSNGRTHVALSPTGIVALGYPLLDGLPQEARDGMWTRTRVLRDDPPDGWEFGAQTSQIDALVIVYARDQITRDQMVEARVAALVAAGAHLYPTQLSGPFTGREPFGFADGLAQPFVPGHAGAPREGQQTIAAGEVVLGYQNAYQQMPASPTLDGFDLGKNGTYLVFRKLRQDVAALWSWVETTAAAIGKDRAWLAAKLMGRWPSGASLAQTWLHDDPAFAAKAKIDAFYYDEENPPGPSRDPAGLHCPVASHVRRANPRDARDGTPDDSLGVVAKHRIVRRGRPFGPPAPADPATPDTAERGLYFICLQASIARGFEFIQQTWLGNHGFHGLYQEVDPVMGNAANTTCITIPAEPFRYRLKDVPDVVHVLGGGYFLLPAKAALAKLAGG
jgi:Dyp-type peroxidase family